MAEARLEGGVPQTAGWFVVNAADAPWEHDDLRSVCRFGGQGEAHFDDLGIALYSLRDGQAMAMYHHEAGQEDFLVLRGEPLLIVEGQERALRAWDLVHCPPRVPHTIVGPGLVLAVGARKAKGSAATRSSRRRSATARACARARSRTRASRRPSAAPRRRSHGRAAARCSRVISIDTLDWPALTDQLDTVGHAVTPPVLDPAECAGLAQLFDGGRFRSTIDMARRRFGDGRYRYFDHPLPEPIPALREGFYGHLAPVANAWAERLRGDEPTFPDTHAELLERCRAAGQERPTPLILRYGVGDWNALHQDLYGDVYFPFQVVTVLEDGYEGGELVLLEQRPRAQSRAHVLRPPRGAFVIFPTRVRPNRGANGYHRVGMRHGVATVTRGQRTALGVIFHDAR